MLKTNRFRTMLIVGTTLLAFPAIAEMSETDMAGDGMAGEETMSPADEARQLLMDTALLDDMRDLEEATATLDEAQMELDQAIDEGAETSVIEELMASRDAAQAALDMESAESMAVADAIAAMSDEQISDTNQALNNTLHNKTIVDLDAETLADIVERDLNRREIQALTKALEEEAKFAGIAARFEDKYAATGKEQFLRNRDRALDRGALQRDKFEGKVDRFVERRNELRSDMRDEVREETKMTARSEARKSVKAEAKRVAREEARRDQSNNGRNNGRGAN